ncbi:hypothetical protein Emed_002267 [Eimeria media]
MEGEEGPLKQQELTCLQQQQSGAPKELPGSPAQLLPLSAIGVVACSSSSNCSCSSSSNCSCSSSTSSPTVADESSEDWGLPESLTETPTGAAHTCYCGLPNSNSSSSSSGCCCRSSSINGEYKWWNPSSNSSSSSSKEAAAADDSESSTVCSYSSRPEGPLEFPPSPATHDADCSSSSSSRSRSCCGSSCCFCSSSSATCWGSKEGESLCLLLKSEPRETSPPSYCSRSSSCCCCGACRGSQPPPPPAAAGVHLQHGHTAAAAGVFKGFPKAPDEEALSEGAPLGAPKQQSADAITPQHHPAAAVAVAAAPASAVAVDVTLVKKEVSIEAPSPAHSSRSSSSSSSETNEIQQQHTAAKDSDSAKPAAPPAAAAAATAAGCVPHLSPWSLAGAPLQPFKGPPRAPGCGELRVCCCFEHLLAGFLGAGGPPCLSGAPHHSSGHVCSQANDGYPSNPQHELEVLLQGAPEAAADANHQGLPSLLSLKKGTLPANDQKRHLSAFGEWYTSIPPWGSPEEGPPTSRPAFGGSPFPEWPSAAGGPFVSEWGAPEQQWASLPLRRETENSSSSSSSISGGEGGPLQRRRLRDRAAGRRLLRPPLSAFGHEGWGPPSPPHLGGPRGGPLLPPAGCPPPFLCPRTPLSTDSFASSSVLGPSTCSSETGSDDDEAESLPPSFGCSGNGGPPPPRKSFAASNHSGATRGPSQGLRTSSKLLSDFRCSQQAQHKLLLPRRRQPGAAAAAAAAGGGGISFCLRSLDTPLRPPHYHALGDHSSAPPAWIAETTEAGRLRKHAVGGGPPGAPGMGLGFLSVGGGGPGGPPQSMRWADNGGREDARHLISSSSSSSNHHHLSGMAAVPVRTRKGFRKPLPLPPEMQAAVSAPGPRKPIEPVLQYDGESREWRVFWMEEPQARYKVFQSKKFGKERAQQLALEWLRRAKLGALNGFARGPRGAGGGGGPHGYRAKRGRQEGGPPLHLTAAELRASSSPDSPPPIGSPPQISLVFSPAGSPLLPPEDAVALPVV